MFNDYCHSSYFTKQNNCNAVFKIVIRIATKYEKTMKNEIVSSEEYLLDKFEMERGYFATLNQLKRKKNRHFESNFFFLAG